MNVYLVKCQKKYSDYKEEKEKRVKLEQKKKKAKKEGVVKFQLLFIFNIFSIFYKKIFLN